MTRHAIALVLIAASLVVLSSPEPARATFPGSNGKIAFAGNDGDAEIFTMNSDGSNVTQLTFNATGDAQPSWSADGQKLAFARNLGDTEIMVMGADGSNPIQLTSNGVSDGYPAWSPDGSKITFTSDVNGDPLVDDFEIFVMNADGTGATQLTNGLTAFGSEFSPDGTKIAYHRGNAGGGIDIVIMNANGSGATPITSGLDPSWSPDGTKLAFWNVTGVHTINVNGTSLADLGTGYEPVWSPDGAKITFVRADATGTHVMVMNADGSNVTPLVTTSATAGLLARPDWQRVDLTFNAKPDGRIRKGSGSFVGNNIYNTDGTNQSRGGSALRGSTITFGISIQNDGNGPDRFRVAATGAGTSMYTVRYFRGTTEITTSVTAGTYQTPQLAPGTSHLITARLKVKQSATVGSSVTRLVIIRSASNASKVDAVKFTGRRR